MWSRNKKTKNTREISATKNMALPMNFNMNYPPNYQNFYHDTLKNLNDPNSNTPKILTDPAKNCTAEHSVIWIYNIFGQCILSNIEMIGFYFGLISIGCWMCSTIPQLVLNCRSGSADKALSFYWFWGFLGYFFILLLA